MNPFTHPGLTVAVGADSVHLVADADALRDWAERPGSSWPCSALAGLDAVTASFDDNGLYAVTGFDHTDGPYGRELDAFSSDAIGAVLPTDHPAWFVTVGQFLG